MSASAAWLIGFAKSRDTGTTNVCCEEGMWLAFDLNILRGASVSTGGCWRLGRLSCW